MSGSVKLDKQPEGVFVLSFCNPSRKNALDDSMITQLQGQLVQLATDPACRVLVFQGKGNDFCAGRDIAQFDPAAIPPETLRSEFDVLRVLMASIQDFPKPTVAVIRGYCLGLGAAIVCLSDLAFASDDTKIGFPEAKVGISPSFTAVALTQSVGSKAAMQLLLTGKTIDGWRAERIGLVTECAADSDLDVLVQSNLTAITQTSAVANRMCKALVHGSAAYDFASALNLALDCTVSAATTADAIEGRAAFRQKRKPRWGVAE